MFFFSQRNTVQSAVSAMFGLLTDWIFICVWYRSTLCSVMAQLTEETQPSFETTLRSKAVSENSNVKFSCLVTGITTILAFATAAVFDWLNPKPLFCTKSLSLFFSKTWHFRFYVLLCLSGHPVPQVIWYKDDIQLDRYCGLPKYEIFRNGPNHSLHIYKYVSFNRSVIEISQESWYVEAK